MAAASEEKWEPPLLSWKGMQLWSVGCRAPALCEIFVGLKAKKLSNLIFTHSQKSKEKRRKTRDSGDGTNSADNANAPPPPPSPPPPPPPRSALQLPRRFSCCSSLDHVPKRRSTSFEERGFVGRRNSDATASTILKPNADILRRKSDASICNLQRLSTASTSGYERVWALEGGGDDAGLDCELPREAKLGGRRSDASASGRQEWGTWAYRRSSCSSFSSSSSVGTAASAAAKLVISRWGGGSSESEQRHLSELVVGNQFLTHVTAAPVSAGAGPMGMRPSGGFQEDASVRCREAELKDRIIFFL